MLVWRSQLVAGRTPLKFAPCMTLNIFQEINILINQTLTRTLPGPRKYGFDKVQTLDCLWR
jgi:hypothetical protein